jgi:hypothetical protein
MDMDKIRQALDAHIQDIRDKTGKDYQLTKFWTSLFPRARLQTGNDYILSIYTRDTWQTFMAHTTPPAPSGDITPEQHLIIDAEIQKQGLDVTIKWAQDISDLTGGKSGFFGVSFPTLISYLKSLKKEGK